MPIWLYSLMAIESSLSLKFAALADPTRRAILIRLAQSDASVAELHKPFAISQPSISKHLKVLENAGLIERGKAAAQSRPRRLNLVALNETSGWFEHVRTLWSDSFDQLDAFLNETAPTTEAGATNAKHRQGRTR
jgi:DNA-binding transcriptional ArsR family regulator